jgi:hypothetical protein
MLIKYLKHSLQLTVWALIGGCIMSIHTSQATCTKQGVQEQHSLKSLTKMLRSQKHVPFQTVDSVRYQYAKSLFKQLLNVPLLTTKATTEAVTEEKLQSELSATVKTLATQAGLCWQWLTISHREQNHTVLLLMEHSDAANKNTQGQGAYLFALNKPLNFVIQAPHQFFDYATGKIALQFFFEQGLRAITINTVHRNQTPQSDLAHQANSLFSAFAEAYAEVMLEKAADKQKVKQAEGYLLQVHGFSNKHRRSEAGKKADVIISNGTRSPSVYLRQSQERINTTSAFKSYLYGVDIYELGGSQNSSLAILKQLNQQAHFIHLELSADTRKELKRSPSQRKQLWRSLQP